MTAHRPFTLVQNLPTPHRVYGVAWSEDGERFAYAGGFLYGDGFVGVATVDAQELTPLRQADLLPPQSEPGFPEALILVNVTFARCQSKELLLVAASSYKWHDRGPLLFACDGLQLTLIDSFVPADDNDDGDEDKPEPVRREQGVGAWLHGGQVLVHHRAMTAEGTLAVYPFVNTRVYSPAVGDPRHLASSNARLAVVDGDLWIAKNRMHTYSQAGTGPPMVPGSDVFLIEENNPHGLLRFDLADPNAPPELVPLPTDWRVNAITRDAAGSRLWLGLNDHRLASFDLASKTLTVMGAVPQGTGFAPPVVRGVFALAVAPDDTLVAAEHARHPALWRNDTLIEAFDVPTGLSPRSLAVHPSGRRLLVGCKARLGQEPGALLCYEAG